jgi:tetratricopeptide (TPR) repeat protein
MTEVALHDYVNEISAMIEGSAYDTAITHCKHILSQYPKYLEAYRLIGKAALEKEDDATAIDIFQRVLAVDPEDFLARVGLSIIFDRDNDLNKAIWHMERAFDLMPSNGVIQGELKRLYARRDGTEPDRISLTRGALARMYAQGDLYPEAIADLKRMLQEQPDRIDLQVLLTQVLWRDDQRIEAADWAQKILTKLPYCLSSNLILGEVWKSSDQQVESEVPLKRAQQIDPENAFATKFFGEVSPLPGQSVTVERLETPYTTSSGAVTAPPEDVPDWLRGLTDITASVPQLEEPGAAKTPKLPTGLHMPGTGSLKSEIPDWLQGLVATNEPTPPAAPEAAPLAVETEPSWLAQLRSAADSSETTAPAVDDSANVPDWISQLGATVPSTETQSIAPTAESSTSEDMPAWLKQPETISAEPGSIVAEPAADMPDWLASLKPPDLEATPSLEKAEPDWLSSVKEEHHLPEFDLPSHSEPAVSTAPEVSEQMPSADDALAFLAKLSAGKEDQLRAQAEQEGTARMDAIMGRKTSSQPATPSAPTPVTTAPEAAVPVPVVETTASAAETVPEEMPSADDALAFLTRLAAGKEDQLRAQAEQEGTARMDVIMGRKTPTGVLRKPGTSPFAEAANLQADLGPIQPTASVVVPAAAMSSADALAFLQRVAADKEAKESQLPAARIETPAASKIEPVPVSFAVPEPEQPIAPISTASAAQASTAALLPAWWWMQTAEEEDEEPIAELPEPYRPPRTPASAAPSAKRERSSTARESAPAIVPAESAEVIAPPIKTTVNVEPLLVRLQADANDHDARLELARAWWSTGERDQALEHYSALVAAEAHTDEAVNDLERIVEIDDRSEWQRLLGDVYMHTGQLTRALDAYHRALNQL